jgi:tetratricopeptide (TPR) repeat protein
LSASLFIVVILLTPLQVDRVAFRMITVANEAKAMELRARILAGESFEALAMENSTDPSGAGGGFVGVFAPADLRQEFRGALSGLTPGQISPVGKIGNEFFLLELVAPSEVEWITENSAAMDALKKRQFQEAAKSFTKAIALAEKFGADDDRLAQSLSGLVEAYTQEQDFASAIIVYRRILAIRWSAASDKGSLAVADLVDRFTDVLRLSYFRGEQFDEALKQFQTALNQTAIGEPLSLAMTGILIKAELNAEAEEVMQRAIRTFPNSRRLRYKEAEMYRDSGSMRKALEGFREASQMKAPSSMSPEQDRLQLSFIYQRIGGINTDLTQFDAAIAAYKKALEISAKNADARMALGDLYLRRGQATEALAEFGTLVSAVPDKAAPLYRLADAHLKLGNFSEAATAAAKALKIDPQERKAHYVMGLALTRMGRTDEGQKELAEYSKQEAKAQAELNEQRDILVSNRGAAALVLDGRGEDAIAAFRKSIEEHRSSGALRLNFGLALGLLGRHEQAVSALKELVVAGAGENFLVYKALAGEYASLKDEKTSQKYAALYVQKIDAALEEELR